MSRLILIFYKASQLHRRQISGDFFGRKYCIKTSLISLESIFEKEDG